MKKVTFKSVHLGGNLYQEYELYYSLGGYNYFTGKEEKRGIWLGSTRLERKGNCVMFQGFDPNSWKVCIKELKRFSKKALEAELADFEGLDEESIKALAVKKAFN